MAPVSMMEESGRRESKEAGAKLKERLERLGNVGDASLG